MFKYCLILARRGGVPTHQLDLSDLEQKRTKVTKDAMDDDSRSSSVSRWMPAGEDPVGSNQEGVGVICQV
jgi:hypothetical protein